MATPTRAQIRTLARLLALDGSATAPQVSDAQANAILDELAEWGWNFWGPRYVTIAAVDDDALLTTGLGFFLNGEYRAVSVLTNYDEIASVHYEGPDSAAVHGPILEWMEYHEIQALRVQSTAVGTPKYAHWFKTAGGAGAWTFMVHPPPTRGGVNQYLSLRVRKDRTAFVSDASVPDLTPIECRMLARLLGYQIAALSKRTPDQLDTIAMLIPDEVKAARGIKLHAQVGVTSVDMG